MTRPPSGPLQPYQGLPGGGDPPIGPQPPEKPQEPDTPKPHLIPRPLLPHKHSEIAESVEQHRLKIESMESLFADMSSRLNKMESCDCPDGCDCECDDGCECEPLDLSAYLRREEIDAEIKRTMSGMSIKFSPQQQDALVERIARLVSSRLLVKVSKIKEKE